jgi:hypothetical protein
MKILFILDNNGNVRKKVWCLAPPLLSATTRDCDKAAACNDTRVEY